MVLIDSHSKWVDVKHMHSTTAQSTMDELRLIFAEHGIPEILVSDNGPPFRSEEFSKFIKFNGIKHVLVPAYHPASNGAAERTVRVVKEALLKQVIEGSKHKTMKHRLARFLLKYRTTPHSTTNCTPAELMVKRQLRTRLSMVKPDLSDSIANKQERQKFYHDGKSKIERKFVLGDKVRI